MSAMCLLSTSLMSCEQKIVVDFLSDTTGSVSYSSTVNSNKNNTVRFNSLEEFPQALNDVTYGNITVESVRIAAINNEPHTIFNAFSNNTKHKFDLLLNGDATGDKQFAIENCSGEIFNDILCSNNKSILFMNNNLKNLGHISLV